MLMYFDLEYYWTMLALVWGEKRWQARRRRQLLLTLLLGVPLMYLFHASFFFLDRLLFPGLWRQRVVAPVFIVGHARSGTTLMHRLMAADGERFSYFLYWEMFFPSLAQKKIIRGLGVLDRRLLGSYCYKRLQAWDEKTFGATRHIHNMGLWIPEEDNFVMTFAFASGFWTLKAPYMEQLDMFYVDRMPPRKRRRWLNYYRECVLRQLYLNGGDKTHLSKNPVFCAWIESLVETFPDAKIVVMMRNPYECIPSLLKLMDFNWKGRGWPRHAYQSSLHLLAQMSFDCYRLPQQALVKHDNTPQAVVDYRKLVAQPRDTVTAVYQGIGLTLSPAYDSVLQQQEAKARSHSSSHSYSLEEFGLDADAIRAGLADFFDQYQWHSDGAEAAQSPDPAA